MSPAEVKIIMETVGRIWPDDPSDDDVLREFARRMQCSGLSCDAAKAIVIDASLRKRRSKYAPLAEILDRIRAAKYGGDKPGAAIDRPSFESVLRRAWGLGDVPDERVMAIYYRREAEKAVGIYCDRDGSKRGMDPPAALTWVVREWSRTMRRFLGVRSVEELRACFGWCFGDWISDPPGSWVDWLG